ncbi:MAG: hypothetical protein AAGF92_02620 [Myxococcota bacterium]
MTRRLAIAFLTIAAASLGCEDETVPPPPSSTGGTNGTGNVAGMGPTGGTSGSGGSAASGGAGGSGATGGAGGSAGSGGSNGTGGFSGNGGGGAGAGGEAGAGGDNGFSGSACINDPDSAVISAAVPNLRQRSAACGVSCQMATGLEFLACVDECFTLSVPDLSTGCKACYLELATCAGPECNAICAHEDGNACSPDCLGNDPLCANYPACLDALNNCAGRVSLDCGGT